jgi:ABC-2 type transport system permease protein
MTTVAPTARDSGVPLTRLVRVELRKTVDTRAGRWLLIAIGVITFLAIALFLGFADDRDLNFADLALVAAAPQGFLLPVLGILTVTSEWSQRTGLVTFTLEPRRGRTLAAKLLAVLLLGLIAIALLLVLAAVATVIAAATGGEGSWDDALSTCGKLCVLQLIGLLSGFALGTILLNSAAAIVLSFVLPTAVSILVGIVTALEPSARWWDINTAQAPLFDDERALDATAWLQIVVTSVWWIWIPLALGARRVLRAEVK